MCGSCFLPLYNSKIYIYMALGNFQHLKKGFYLFDKESERVQAGGRVAEGAERQGSQLSGKPDVRFNSRTLGL